jgi:transcriptional regulator NrdR family protein
MPRSTKQRTNPADHVGLRCRKCAERRFRVIYTRGSRDGKIIRRRECRTCGTRVTTWEHMIGV